MTEHGAINREQCDALLAAMLHNADGVSDLLFVVGKPPQVESHGKLKPLDGFLPGSVLTPAFAERLALFIINGNDRLLADFTSCGSCDCSYTVENVARFRVNIFRQNGHHAIVMRKLQSRIPSLDELKKPLSFTARTKTRWVGTST